MHNYPIICLESKQNQSINSFKLTRTSVPNSKTVAYTNFEMTNNF